jgi:hypothetical protein
MHSKQTVNKINDFLVDSQKKLLGTRVLMPLQLTAQLAAELTAQLAAERTPGCKSHCIYIGQSQDAPDCGSFFRSIFELWA